MDTILRHAWVQQRDKSLTWIIDPTWAQFVHIQTPGEHQHHEYITPNWVGVIYVGQTRTAEYEQGRYDLEDWNAYPVVVATTAEIEEFRQSESYNSMY